MSPTVAPRRYTAQTAAGLTLAAAILCGWLTLHGWSMLAFRPQGLEWLLGVPLIALSCWLSVGLFIVAHDAMHGSLAPGRPRLNGAIGATLLFLYAGFAWRRMRDAHFQHHRAPGSADDPDFDPDHPTRFGRWYLTFLRRYFGWQSIAYVGTVVTVYWTLLDIPLANIVLFYGVPAIGSSLQLFYFGTYRPHRHDAHGFIDRHRARSDSFGTLASLFSCFHFGYHHEHHLSPHVPWWRLPARRRASESA